MTRFNIAGRPIGEGHPCYVIAEISCNHEGNFDEARRIIEAAAQAGADSVKIQTYRADTITRNFKTRAKGTIWENIDIYDIYQKAHTPWDWHKNLKKVADDHGLHLFSSPFDETAVEHLETMDVPVYKVASFEVVDIKLLEAIAATGKPVIMSNGMTDFLEMDEAVRTLRGHGTKDLAILHCNSGYPAEFSEANLATIPVIADLFGCVTGLSDHTMFADTKNYRQPLPHITPFEAVSRFGAKILEVHLTLDRERGRQLMEAEKGGFDWPFSREPDELRRTVEMIRAWESGQVVDYATSDERAAAQATHGQVCFEPTPKEIASRAVRPSLWVVEDVKAGESLHFCGGKPGNVDSIRPGGGLHIRFADLIDGKKAVRDIPAGMPLAWDMVDMQSAAVPVRKIA